MPSTGVKGGPREWFGAGLFSEVPRFVLIGAMNTLGGYAVFVIVLLLGGQQLRFGYFLALGVSYLVMVPAAFFLYQRFVFTHATITLGNFARFVLTNLAAIGLNFVCLYLLVEFVELSSYVGQAITLVVVVAFSYLGHRFFSFR